MKSKKEIEAELKIYEGIETFDYNKNPMPNCRNDIPNFKGVEGSLSLFDNASHIQAKGKLSKMI